MLVKELMCRERLGVQAERSEELADGDHEHPGVGDSEPRRELRQSVAHGLEHAVQRPCDDDIEDGHEVQAQDAEPEHALVAGDVLGCPCGIPRNHEPLDGDEVSKGREHRHGQESDSRSGAGPANRVVRLRADPPSEGFVGWGPEVVSGHRHRAGAEGGGRRVRGPGERCSRHGLSDGRWLTL